MNFTLQQQQAIAARGNVLVVAGAGTGKTRTLVERCLKLLLDENPAVSLEEILMVTFTEAAAAEMRQRIRARLEEELAKVPKNFELEKQLALFDSAHIGTLHGFCLKLIRQHFYELELDPQLTVLAEEEARLLADETLDDILQCHYAGDGALAEAVQGLIQTQGRGWDKPVRALVFKLHNYTQTLPDPAGWFDQEIKIFESAEPVKWRKWFDECAVEWRESSLDFVTALAGKNELAAKVATTLLKLSKHFTRTEFADALERISEIPDECPHGKKGKLVGPLEDFFAEARFLFSLARETGGVDPLAEDWNWSRMNMLALLRLAEDFGRKFAEAKRELGAVDFHDLEQHALRLLWDRTANQPTAIAREWRQKLRFIFVDEYQDINAAQDKIIEAMGRDAASANRFLVGDIKQSIYRFRLANPRIFQNHSETWRGDQGQTIPLTENFRSHEGVINFVNSLFTLVMRGEAGGLNYDDEAQLLFGAAKDRAALSLAADPSPRVELHLRFTGESEVAEENEAQPDVAELESANKEARLVALRLRELKEQHHQIWDEDAKNFRAVEWSDMAVLLRSPGSKADIFAREFSQASVPLIVARGGFFASLEISDLLCLLQLLDNPLQDVPALAVLHSPLVGLTPDELATIRLAAMKVPFWTALLGWRDLEKAESGKRKAESEEHPASTECEDHVADTFVKVDLFLQRFAYWRRLARQISLSRCLESVLAETHYAEGLLTQPRGEQRRANVQRLLNLAQQFDQFQRQGLFRFLRFVEAQQAAELEPEVAAATDENAVRLMSIHQSKGLEFPVVVVANLAKPFNFSDLKADIILHEKFGLCPQIKPPHTGRRYPSVTHWLAGRRQEIETLGEELRLLYVATTRARDTLILTASITGKKFESLWNEAEETNAPDVLSARSYADWMGMWFARKMRGVRTQVSGEKQTDNSHLTSDTRLMRWEIWDDARLISPPAELAAGELNAVDFSAEPDVWNELERRMAWQYPFSSASEKVAKVSVSTLRREAVDADEEAETLFRPKVQSPKSKVTARRAPAGGKSAADVGTAHHKFLQLIALDRCGGATELEAEARRLESAGGLLAEESAALDFKLLAAFWQSDLGQKIRGQKNFVHRELEFTARFSLAEIAELTAKPLDAGLRDEFVVVQGIADLAVILEKEIWLLDFKTDDVRGDELRARVKTYEPQLRLYSSALARIYGRPVTNCWLYFLSSGQVATVSDESASKLVV